MLAPVFPGLTDGVRVTVVDKGEMGREASWAGAGIIPPGNPDRAAHPGDRLRALSSRMYPALSAELRERTDALRARMG